MRRPEERACHAPHLMSSLPHDSPGLGRSRNGQGGDESGATLIYVEYGAKELLQILMETGTSYRNGLRNHLRTNRDK